MTGMTTPFARRYRFTLLVMCLLCTTLNAYELLTTDAVDQRLQSLNSADEESPTRLAYESARRWLEAAQAHKQDAAAFTQAVARAEKRKAVLLSRMDNRDQTQKIDEADFASMSLVQLDLRTAERRARLSEATGESDALDRKVQARELNAASAHQRLGKISTRLQELSENESELNSQATPSLLQANQWNAIAERQALEAERQALNARLSSQPTRYSLIQLQRAELVLSIESLEAELSELEDHLAEREDAGETLVAIRIAPERPAYAIAESLAAENLGLRQQQRQLAQQRRSVASRIDRVQRQSSAVNARRASARRVVEFAGDSSVLGNVLLVHWREFDNLSIGASTEDLDQTIGDTVINRIAHEERVATLASSSAFVRQQLQDAQITPAQVSDLERTYLRDDARRNREQLSQLIAEESSFIEASAQLKTEYRRLDDLMGEYEHYLTSLILWVPSHPPITAIPFEQLPAELRKLAASRPNINPGTLGSKFVLGILVLALLLIYRKRMRQAIADTNRKVARPREDDILASVYALALTMLAAARLPLAMYLLSTLFGSGDEPISKALCNALQLLALPAYLAKLLIDLCSAQGVGRQHFGWNAAVCDRSRHELKYLLRLALPLVAVTVSVIAWEAYLGTSSAPLGHLLYLCLLLFSILRLVWLLKNKLRHHPDDPPSIARRRLLLVALLLNLAGFTAIAMGHVYSVNILLQAALMSTTLMIGLRLLYDLLLRWLTITRRRLRMAELLAAFNDREEAGTITEDGQTGAIELSDASSQLLRAGINTLGVAGLINIWSPLLPVLESMDKITLWTSRVSIDGEPVVQAFSLKALLLVVVLSVATFYAARKVPALIELLLRQHSNISPSARYTSITLINYAIIGAGLATVFRALGLNWSQMQWLVAALGVGIGFGLQEIVANFISGLIILFERPIRVGDVVTVGSRDGTVTRIRIRATTIRDWDGKELLVPNKEFITSQLLNWTLSDNLSRVVINVGIAYGSDVEQAMALLHDIIGQHPDIMDEPAPAILFTELGDNALILALRSFIRSVDDRMRVISELHRSIYRRFNEAGLEFGFPQLDVHLDPELPARLSTLQKPETPASV